MRNGRDILMYLVNMLWFIEASVDNIEKVLNISTENEEAMGLL